MDCITPRCLWAGLGRLLVTGLLLAITACASAPMTEPSPVAPAPESGRTVLKLSAMGDIMLGGSAAPEVAKTGYDQPFEGVRTWLADSHIVFGNLEGPLTDRGRPEADKQYVFRSPPDKVAPALQRAGFNIVSLANNHTLDYGPEGLAQTIEALDREGIRYAGAGENVTAARRAAVLEQAGRKVAFLAYSLTFPENYWAGKDTPGTAFGHERHIVSDVQQAKASADIVVVSFHWGREVETELRDYQPYLAHAAIDAGAALILGHHPHILQGIERYKDGLILYSLGNFTFGSFSKRATRSVIAQCLFEDNKVSGLRLIPINVDNTEVVFQPQPLTGNEADKVLADLNTLSNPLGTYIENRDGIGVIELTTVARE